MLTKIKLILGVLLLFSAIAIPVAATHSQPVAAQAAEQINKGVKQAGGDKNTKGLPGFIENITNLLLFLVGVIAVIAIVISGLRFVTANGNQDQVASARNGIIYAVVGIVVAMMAYAIVRFVTNNL